MARPINAVITAPGTYVWALDHWVNPFNVALDAELSGGTVSYTFNYTLDPINPEVGVGYGVAIAPNPTWTNLSGTWPATGSLAPVTLTSPIRALQLVVTALSGGTLTVNIIQPSSFW